MLFHFEYTTYNINKNNHVYQVNMMSGDAFMIEMFEKGFINEVFFIAFSCFIFYVIIPQLHITIPQNKYTFIGVSLSTSKSRGNCF